MTREVTGNRVWHRGDTELAFKSCPSLKGAKFRVIGLSCDLLPGEAAVWALGLWLTTLCFSVCGWGPLDISHCYLKPVEVTALAAPGILPYSSIATSGRVSHDLPELLV